MAPKEQAAVSYDTIASNLQMFQPRRTLRLAPNFSSLIETSTHPPETTDGNYSEQIEGSLKNGDPGPVSAADAKDKGTLPVFHQNEVCVMVK